MGIYSRARPTIASLLVLKLFLNAKIRAKGNAINLVY